MSRIISRMGLESSAEWGQNGSRTIRRMEVEWENHQENGSRMIAESLVEWE